MHTTIGLDIGSHKIKLVELTPEGGNMRLVAVGSIPTPPKSLTANAPSDIDAVGVAVKKLLRDTGAKSRTVSISFPESLVFTRVIEVPALSQRELASAIKWEAEQYIPLPLDQVNVDFTVLRDSKETGTNKMDVLLVAAPRALVEKYMAIMEAAEVTVSVAETEIIATSRALARTMGTLKSAMIVSLGAQTTDLAIIRSGILVYTRSISAGGEALSRALAQGLGFEILQAEEFKRAYGLEKDKLQGKILTAIAPIMDTIVGEIKRAMAFFGEKHKDEQIETVFLSGGTARLPGMVVYMAEHVGIEAQLANPWLGIIKDPRFASVEAEGASYAVAIGLALR